MRKTAPWHYVDVPLDEPRYDAQFSGDDPKKGCVVDEINEFRAIMKDPTRSKTEARPQPAGETDRRDPPS